MRTWISRVTSIVVLLVALWAVWLPIESLTQDAFSKLRLSAFGTRVTLHNASSYLECDVHSDRTVGTLPWISASRTVRAWMSVWPQLWRPTGPYQFARHSPERFTFTVPPWVPAFPGIVIAAFRIFAWRPQIMIWSAQVRERERNRSATCGFDRRATPDRRPECGDATPLGVHHRWRSSGLAEFNELRDERAAAPECAIVRDAATIDDECTAHVTAPTRDPFALRERASAADEASPTDDEATPPRRAAG